MTQVESKYHFVKLEKWVLESVAHFCGQVRFCVLNPEELAGSTGPHRTHVGLLCATYV